MPIEERRAPITEHGLVYARLFDGAGGGTPLEWEDLRSDRDHGGLVWIHLDREHPDARQWLFDEAGIDPLTAEALIAEETRPRIRVEGDTLFLILRGVNLNPGRDPDDMVAIRCFIETNRIITLRAEKVMAIQDIREALDAGSGPRSPGDFMALLARRLIERMNDAIHELDEALDDIEASLAEERESVERFVLGRTRRIAITLRRYLAPQRDVITQLASEHMGWWGQAHVQRIREVADRITRYVEDLDAIRERAAVIQDEVTTRQAEAMNRTMYLLSIVAAIFLPLGLITGLLGINVGGIPGTNYRYAFAIVCLVLLALSVAMVWTFRRRNWL